MGAAFVITLREAFEASLILGIVYAYLEKVGARDGFRFVTWGGTVGLLLSVAMGIAVTFLFLWGIMAQAEGAAGWSSVIGGVAGVALAAAIGWAIFHGGRHISLSRFFTVTTAFIMLLAAGLFATGVGRLQGLGFLPLSEPVWNTSWLLSDKSVAGGFLSGLIGYRSQPTVPELVVYAGYILVMGIVLFGRRTQAGVALPDPTQ